MISFLAYSFFITCILYHISINCIVSCHQAVQHSHANNSNYDDFNSFAIVTVIDLSSRDVVRDALTLIRSIRSFGGLYVNQATLLAYIFPMKQDQQSESMAKLIEILSSESVSWHIVQRDATNEHSEVFNHDISPSSIPWSKTANKFIALSLVNASEYRYVLWLDADTVVLGDFIPYLSPHNIEIKFTSGSNFGEITCATELYSYMRRFPGINASSSSWNQQLEPFINPIESEISPHGTCNTGVILFDKYSLPAILKAIDELSTTPTILQHHIINDRFLDSLLFVLAINKIGIHTRSLPYSLNYMAFFEVELAEDLNSTEVVIAHFLSNTSFECKYETHENKYGCFCTYYNPNYVAYSAIGRKLDDLKGYLDVCVNLVTRIDEIAALRHDWDTSLE